MQNLLLDCTVRTLTYFSLLFPLRNENLSTHKEHSLYVNVGRYHRPINHLVSEINFWSLKCTLPHTLFYNFRFFILKSKRDLLRKIHNIYINIYLYKDNKIIFNLLTLQPLSIIKIFFFNPSKTNPVYSTRTWVIIHSVL